MSSVIGLAGTKGSGKDTVAAFLKDHMGYRLHDHADPIRKAFDAVVGIEHSHYRTEHQYKEDKIPGFGFSYRQFAEAFGSAGMMGELDPDWALGAAQSAYYAGGKLCFTNLRTDHELLHAQQHCKAEIWWIDRPNNPYDDGSGAKTEQDYSHLADVIVPNTGSIQNLYNWIRSRL